MSKISTDKLEDIKNNLIDKACHHLANSTPNICVNHKALRDGVEALVQATTIEVAILQNIAIGNMDKTD